MRYVFDNPTILYFSFPRTSTVVTIKVVLHQLGRHSHLISGGLISPMLRTCSSSENILELRVFPGKHFPLLQKAYLLPWYKAGSSSGTPNVRKLPALGLLA